jgi:hypothetical protein
MPIDPTGPQRPAIGYDDHAPIDGFVDRLVTHMPVRPTRLSTTLENWTVTTLEK